MENKDILYKDEAFSKVLLTGKEGVFGIALQTPVSLRLLSNVLSLYLLCVSQGFYLRQRSEEDLNASNTYSDSWDPGSTPRSPY